MSAHTPTAAEFTFAETYRAIATRIGMCPIEAGAIGQLADHECKHGRLPGDKPENRAKDGCSCWDAA